jgi:hypothetical protein
MQRNHGEVMLSQEQNYKSFDDNMNNLIKITDPESPFYYRTLECQNVLIPVITRELWTARQRQAHSLHEISYRACFKPQLPCFFIAKLTKEGDVVYDPFAGRGTTALEASFLNRRAISNDINPLSKILSAPRLRPPLTTSIAERLKSIPKEPKGCADIDLSMFFESRTLLEIVALREYLSNRADNNEKDYIDEWIQMVATNRLTGHSSGFFSVYTLPPNQAASPESQVKINLKYEQEPEYRNTNDIILKKTRTLLSDLRDQERESLHSIASSAVFLSCDARATDKILSETVSLTVTSPPFLDTVQYASDNWMRCWFNSLDAEKIAEGISVPRSVDAWKEVMADVFVELFRITKCGGHVAFEVGEIRKGNLKLDEIVIPLAMKAGFSPIGVLLNEQVFTKTAHIWGVKNNTGGTNTNRIVLLRKC